MKLWLVEILVRLGVAVIADGRCRPRWYGSDQSRVVRNLRGVMWSKKWRDRVGGAFDSRYYAVKMYATGSTKI